MKLLAHLTFKQGHGIGLGLLGNLDVGFHGLVIRVTGPFHDHLLRNFLAEGDCAAGVVSIVIPSRLCGYLGLRAGGVPGTGVSTRNMQL